MSNWAPVPRRPLLNQGLFQFDEEVNIVKKSLTPIERQRAMDGTPITRTAQSALAPAGPELKLRDFDNVNKSMEADRKAKAAEKEKNKIDPAEVVKSYLAL